MNRTRAAAGLLTLVALLSVGACGSAAEDKPTPPAVVEDIPGTDVKQVTFAGEADEAIGVTTTTVAKVGKETSAAGGALSIPYAAVLYYVDGSTWVYTETAEHSYRRSPITVTTISGDTATLSTGPAAGSKVVVVGGPELLGAELGIDGEQ